MSVIAAYYYNEGKRIREIAIDELVGNRIRYGKTAIFTGHNHLISVRHGNAGALGNLREQLEASPALFGIRRRVNC